MRKFVYSIILGCGLHPVLGIYEFDELAHKIIDDVNLGRDITHTFVEDWYDNGNKNDIQAVLEAFRLPKAEAARKGYLSELSQMIDEGMTAGSKAKLHELVQKISPEKRDPITLLLFNYMYGLPQ